MFMLSHEKIVVQNLADVVLPSASAASFQTQGDSQAPVVEDTLVDIPSTQADAPNVDKGEEPQEKAASHPEELVEETEEEILLDEEEEQAVSADAPSATSKESSLIDFSAMDAQSAEEKDKEDLSDVDKLLEDSMHLLEDFDENEEEDDDDVDDDDVDVDDLIGGGKDD